VDDSIPFWEGDISLAEFGKRLCPQETELDVIARKVCQALAADRCEIWRDGSRIPASYFQDGDEATRTLQQELSRDRPGRSSRWQVRRSFHWRTIAQVAVWIRTRDQAKVEGLSERQARCLFLADQAYPGAFAAAQSCLIDALKRGRFSACAARAQPHVTTRDGELGYWRLDERREFIPRLFWERGGFELSDGAVVARGWDDSEEWDGRSQALRVMPSDRPVHWIDIVIDDDDCVGHWQAPASILEDGPLPLAQVLELLSDEDVPEWFLALPAVTVTGLDGAGTRVPVDRGVFEACTIDRANNVLSTGDGGLTWRAVRVELDAAGALHRDTRVDPPMASPGAGPPSVRRDSNGHVVARPPVEFEAWVRSERTAGHVIAIDGAGGAWAAMRRAFPGREPARDTVISWVKTLPEEQQAKRGTPPGRARQSTDQG
jgi:hypothetical protein